MSAMVVFCGMLHRAFDRRKPFDPFLYVQSMTFRFEIGRYSRLLSTELSTMVPTNAWEPVVSNAMAVGVDMILSRSTKSKNFGLALAVDYVIWLI